MKKEEKEIPLKNYVYVLVMLLIVIAIVFGLRTWYRNYKKYEFSTPVISGKIQEISINEFKEFITSHDDFYLYIGTSSNKACRDLEVDLVELLKEYNVKNDTVYLNATSSSRKEVTELLKNYGYNGKEVTYPVFLAIKDNYIISLKMKKTNNLTLKDIEKLLQANGETK